MHVKQGASAVIHSTEKKDSSSHKTEREITFSAFFMLEKTPWWPINKEREKKTGQQREVRSRSLNFYSKEEKSKDSRQDQGVRRCKDVQVLEINDEMWDE